MMLRSPFKLVVQQSSGQEESAAGYLQYYQLQSKMDQLSNAAHSLVHCRLHSVQLFTGRAATQVRDRRGRKVGSQRQVGSQILFTCWEILFVVSYWDDLMMKKIVQEVRCYGRIVIDDDVKSSNWSSWIHETPVQVVTRRTQCMWGAPIKILQLQKCWTLKLEIQGDR